MSELKWIYSKKMVDNLNGSFYPILLLVGPTGAGKSTLANYLELNYGDIFTVVKNYTTRPKRKSDNPNHFKYLSESEFELFKNNNLFFLSRYSKFPSYGYINDEISMIMNMKKIPVFMFRYSGLIKILELLSNVYIINISSSSEKCGKYSNNEVHIPTVDVIRDYINKIKEICSLRPKDKTIEINNNYDFSFFNNYILTSFLEKIISDKGRIIKNESVKD